MKINMYNITAYNFLLYFHTIKYLKIKQVIWRIWYGGCMDYGGCADQRGAGAAGAQTEDKPGEGDGLQPAGGVGLPGQG